MEDWNFLIKFLIRERVQISFWNSFYFHTWMSVFEHTLYAQKHSPRYEKACIKMLKPKFRYKNFDDNVLIYQLFARYYTERRCCLEFLVYVFRYVLRGRRSFVAIHRKKAFSRTMMSNFRHKCVWNLTSTSSKMPLSHGWSHLQDAVVTT